MKRLCSLLLTIIIVLALLPAVPLTAEAATNGICGAGLTWTLDTEGTVTISGTGAMYDYNSDGDWSPWLCNTSIKQVVIEQGVTTIGDNAFTDCTNLTSVTISASVITIGQGSFSGCTKLESITIPDSVRIIGNGAFYGCSAMTVAELGNHVTRIGNSAFAECYSLYNISLPNRLAYIGCSAFSGCNSLSHSLYGNACYIGNEANPYLVLTQAASTAIGACVVHPETKLICANAFAGCTELTEVSIPESVSYIGEYAFYDSTELLYNEYDNACYLGNEENPYHTLLKATSKAITSCDIHENTKVICPYAFYNCDSLGDIKIPDNTVMIGDYAFAECDISFSVTIGNSVMNIGNGAFSGSWLRSIAMPESVVFIGDNAFYDTGIAGVSIPEGTIYIGGGAFWNCYSLAEVTVPNSVIHLGSFAFAYCEVLTSATVGAGVPAIGDYTFFRCYGLSEVTIGGNTASIGANAFSGCTALETVNYYGTPEQLNNMRREIENAPLLSANIRYNYNLGSGYCGADLIWKIDSEGVLTISGSGPMDDYTYGTAPWYSARSAIKKVILPSEIVSVGNHVFWGCRNLTEINIPNCITEIGDYAFYGTALKEVSVPAAVTAIGDYTFHLCAELEGIWVAQDNPNYSSDSRGVLFNKDQSLLIAAPGYLYGDYEVPNTVTTIADDAFRCCTYLVTVTVPDSVTSVGDRAFNYCYSLIDVYYSGTRTGWNAVSIGNYNAPLLDARLHIGKIINGDIDANDILSTDDAVYLLLTVMFGPEDYPLADGVELDINGSGEVDTDDAVYLLLHVMFGEEDYPI